MQLQHSYAGNPKVFSACATESKVAFSYKCSTFVVKPERGTGHLTDICKSDAARKETAARSKRHSAWGKPVGSERDTRLIT